MRHAAGDTAGAPAEAGAPALLPDALRGDQSPRASHRQDDGGPHPGRGHAVPVLKQALVSRTPAVPQPSPPEPTRPQEPREATPHQAPTDQRAATRRRRWGLPALVVGSIALAAVSGAVARDFVSPAQQAARASAPMPSLITTPVRYGALPLDVVMRATVSHNHPFTIQPPPNQSEPEVVTSVNVRPGERVSPGQLIATVAEQPVFVMAGPVPAFRSIVPGTTGIDVRELQLGLAAAGYRTDGDRPGT